MKPKIVNVLGEDYEISFVKPETMPGLMGLCYLDKKKIEVINNLTAEETMSTCLHEVLHGILMESGVAQTIPVEINEVLCETIPKALMKNFNIKFKKVK